MSDITNSLFGNTETQVQESLKDKHYAKLLEEIYSTNNIDLKTDLNQKQINAITKGKLFANTYNCQIMMDLCNLHETLLISKNRAGRKEFIEMSKSVTTDDAFSPSIKERLLG